MSRPRPARGDTRHRDRPRRSAPAGVDLVWYERHIKDLCRFFERCGGQWASGGQLRLEESLSEGGNSFASGVPAVLQVSEYMTGSMGLHRVRRTPKTAQHTPVPATDGLLFESREEGLWRPSAPINNQSTNHQTLLKYSQATYGPTHSYRSSRSKQVGLQRVKWCTIDIEVLFHAIGVSGECHDHLGRCLRHSPRTASPPLLGPGRHPLKCQDDCAPGPAGPLPKGRPGASFPVTARRAPRTVPAASARADRPPTTARTRPARGPWQPWRPRRPASTRSCATSRPATAP